MFHTRDGRKCIHLLTKELPNTMLIAKLLLFRVHQEHSEKCSKIVTAEDSFCLTMRDAADMTMVPLLLIKYSVVVHINMYFKVKS